MTILQKVSDLIRDPRMQMMFANKAFAVYCAAKGDSPPTEFTAESDELNFRLNQLGFAAAISLATQGALVRHDEATYESAYVNTLLELADPETYKDPNFRKFVEAGMHGVWMGCQAGRSIKRFEHKDYVPFELLDESTANLDAIQVQAAAQFILEHVDLNQAVAA